MTTLGHQSHLSLFSEQSLSGAALLHHAVETIKPARTFALFSGGHDSLVATHIAMATHIPTAVVHIDTGIGLTETREFFYSTCDRYGWPLRVCRARYGGHVYEDIVREYGFCGPAQHMIMYSRLKERALRQLTAESKTARTDAVLFVSGCRAAESKRRMGNVEPIKRDGSSSRWFTAVCHDMTDAARDAYIEDHSLPKNPVKAKICMSGECLCGAFASPGELAELTHWFPNDPAVQLLNQLSREEIAKGRWGYGQFKEHQKCRRVEDLEGGPLCTSCVARAADMFPTFDGVTHEPPAGAEEKP